MDIKCIHCGEKHFADEKVAHKIENSFNDCCGHGAVKLDDLPEFPETLKSYFEGYHEKSTAFFDRIRNYNSTFSLASFNANLVKFPSRGPYCFKIQGQIYYQMNTALYPNTDEQPSYGQLFIYDAEEAIDYRINRNVNSDRSILTYLEQMMRENNEFAQSFIMMKDEIERQRELRNNESEPELQLLFSLKPGHDKNRYNFQRTNEIAAIFLTTADGDIPESYVTVRNKNTGILQSLSSMDPNVEPMIYPLFYPYGSRGWHRNIRRRVVNVNGKILLITLKMTTIVMIKIDA
ncbi:hypothetical protein BT93_L1265 [Corymbia citriodora subsp. variegata]|uniref:Helitron helicase-like domain-containing protein n=1 Tax=Corymbia citriodora subsp. variegata TaxID=360336 RepID=A0A8T0CEF3_CORYI|nr:hypothetical protein BT93_L1265 [Corymbia citriodora subsp. variegata]